MRPPEFNDEVQFLQRLVEINSGTQNSAGVNQVQDWVQKSLEELQFDLTFHPHPQNQSGRLLIGSRKLQASGELGAELPPFVIDLVTHADTVFEADSGFLEFKIDSSHQTATGPGVIDDKGGIVIALGGLKRFFKNWNQKACLRPVMFRFICTPSEELGSPGFTPLLHSLGQQSNLILGFEPSFSDGSIIESRRGNRWYHLDILGKEGHAGRDHALGLNAAHELAFKITRLHALTDYRRNLTVSVGEIGGGSKFNIICGKAFAKIDARFPDFPTREKLDQQIKEIFETSFTHNQNQEHPIASYSIADDCPPFSSSKDAHSYIQKYLKVVYELEGRTIQSRPGTGSADANYMSQPDSVILDGLGAIGGAMHSKNEFILLSSLETRAEALARFLKIITEENGHTQSQTTPKN